MMRIDIRTQHQWVSRLQAAALWGGVLVLVGFLWVGPGGLATVRAQDTPPAAQQAGEPREHLAVPMTDIHDIKPALDMGADVGRLIWLAIAVLAVAAVAAVAWRLWRRRELPAAEPAAAPLPPPEAEAYALLDGLAAGDHGDLKRFYFQLSAILRRYVERRYGFPAAEMTSEELLPAVGRLDLSPDLSRQIREFCLRSDLIKFAGAAADGSRVAHELALVRDVVRQTTRVHVETGSDLKTVMKADEASQTLPDTKKIEYQGIKQGESKPLEPSNP